MSNIFLQIRFQDSIYFWHVAPWVRYSESSQIKWMSSRPLGLSSHQKRASLRVQFVTGNYRVPPIWCHILSSGSIKSYSISGKRIQRQRQMLNFAWTRGTSTIEMTIHCNLTSEIQFLTQSPWSYNEFLGSLIVLLRQFVNFHLQLWFRHGQGGRFCSSLSQFVPQTVW